MKRDLRGVAMLIALAVACSSRSERSEPEPLTPEEEQARDLGRQMQALARTCERDRDLVACQDACDRSHSNSCARSGQLLATADPAAARRRLTQACDGGSGIGCQELAGLDAPGAPALLARARRYHEVHCGQGFAPSCAALAGLWQRGEGGAASAATAAHWQAMACRLEPATCDGAGRR